MARVTDSDVRAVCGIAIPEGDTSAAITVAETLVNDVSIVDPSLTVDRLKIIEMYLAAHFFFLSVKRGPLAAEVLGDASERYHNIFGQGLKATVYGQQAIGLDPTRTLALMADSVENANRKTALFSVIGSNTVGSGLL